MAARASRRFLSALKRQGIELADCFHGYDSAGSGRLEHGTVVRMVVDNVGACTDKDVFYLQVSRLSSAPCCSIGVVRCVPTVEHGCLRLERCLSSICGWAAL